MDFPHFSDKFVQTYPVMKQKLKFYSNLIQELSKQINYKTFIYYFITSI